jgi:hypothetical protein
VLATASGAAVAAKDPIHSLAASVQVRRRRSGNAQAPLPAHLPSLFRSQRFAATNLGLSTHCVQSVRGAAATRTALPSFTAGGGGGLSSACSSSPRWRISVQKFKAMPVCLALSHRPGSPRAVLPNPSLEWTRTGIALGPPGAHCHHSPRGPSAIPVLAPQLKR